MIRAEKGKSRSKALAYGILLSAIAFLLVVLRLLGSLVRRRSRRLLRGVIIALAHVSVEIVVELRIGSCLLLLGRLVLFEPGIESAVELFL